MATTTVDEHGAQPASSAPKPITDKYHLVQIVFFLHGISALLPWNMLINADSYFVDYKLNPDGPMFYQNEPNNNNLLSIDCRQFANQSDCLAHSAEVLSASSNGSSLLLSNSSSSISSQYIHKTSTSSSPALANYRANFLPYLSTASKLPNIVFQLVNLLFSSSYVASSCRLVFAFYIQIGLFILTISLALVDTSAWPEAFFWVTMAVAVLFNTVNGIYQSCIYGIGAKFAKMRYTNAITLGFSFSGSIASMFLIVSLLLSPHPRTVAVLYFTFATVFMAVCLVNEYLVRRNAYLQYNVLLNETEEVTNGEQNFSLEENDKKEENNNNSSSSSSKIDASTQVIFESEITTSANLTTRQSYLLILNKSWLQLLNIVLIYFVSFSIFPAVQAAIRPVNALLPEKFFAPVFCFLFFNSWATLGNFISERTMTPSPKHLHYLVLLRFLFIPFFLACNYLPSERKWAVTFSNDYIYAIGSALMAFTSGYTSALAMMYVPKSVPVRWASTAAMMASAAVIIGILAGVQFSIVLRHLVT